MNAIPAGPSVTLYSKPRGCVQCDAVKRAFDKAEIAYEVIGVDLDVNAHHRAKITAMGYFQAPVVIWRDADGVERHFSGFRPDEVKHVIAVMQKAAA